VLTASRARIQSRSLCAVPNCGRGRYQIIAVWFSSCCSLVCRIAEDFGAARRDGAGRIGTSAGPLVVVGEAGYDKDHQSGVRGITPEGARALPNCWCKKHPPIRCRNGNIPIKMRSERGKGHLVTGTWPNGLDFWRKQARRGRKVAAIKRHPPEGVPFPPFETDTLRGGDGWCRWRRFRRWRLQRSGGPKRSEAHPTNQRHTSNRGVDLVRGIRICFRRI
jgi:hypothetical protein